MESRNILLYGLNWLGDSVMAMPALRRLIDTHPANRFTMLVKPTLQPLWQMFPGLANVRPLRSGLRGLAQTVLQLRREHWHAAYVLQHSSRSAITTTCAGIPDRIGTRGHELWPLLTRAVPLPPDPHHHQSLEYASLFDISFNGVQPMPPRLEIPREAEQAANAVVDGPGPLLALIPGAARGPSKRWPSRAFAAAGRRLAEETGARCVILGSSGDSAICRSTCDAIGPPAIDLAGRTTLPELAALLRRCRVAITNDSGGMHLAAAMGTPVVAVFGMTDPRRTGPLGSGHRIVCAEGFRPSRNIRRNSTKARRALESIAPERVVREALDVFRALSQADDDRPRAHALARP